MFFTLDMTRCCRFAAADSGASRASVRYISGLGSDEGWVDRATRVPRGRTDANCHAIDTFFSRDGSWVGARVPNVYHDIIADMSARRMMPSAGAEIAANVDSTGQNKSHHAIKRDGSL